MGEQNHPIPAHHTSKKLNDLSKNRGINEVLAVQGRQKCLWKPAEIAAHHGLGSDGKQLQSLQQLPPQQTFPLLYLALISTALHPATPSSSDIFSLSIWQRNKTWDELL